MCLIFFCYKSKQRQKKKKEEKRKTKELAPHEEGSHCVRLEKREKIL